MILYLKISFWLCVAGVGTRLLFLSFGTYPRKVVFERWEDALSVVVSSAIAVWLFTLVWGAK